MARRGFIHEYNKRTEREADTLASMHSADVPEFAASAWHVGPERARLDACARRSAGSWTSLTWISVECDCFLALLCKHLVNCQVRRLGKQLGLELDSNSQHIWTHHDVCPGRTGVDLLAVGQGSLEFATH